MGNRVGIYPTKFVDIDLDGTERHATYGLRVADDHGNAYSNTFERDQIVGRTPKEIVDLARTIDDAARDMIEFAEEAKDGISIGDDDYTWEQINGSGPKV